MKTRIILAALLLGSALSAGAQNMYDALKFSSTQYYGSARTVGMGNAVTAVGGDIGSITFNPAGSAVAGYSQISVTPVLSISSNRTTGSILTEGATLPDGFGDDNTSRHPRMAAPSFGAVLNVDTHRSRGLVSYSWGIVGNSTNNFLNEVYASGVNTRTTYLGYLATQADGIPSSGLNSSSAYNNYPWLPVTAYQGGLIATYGGYTDKYAGATEFIEGDDIGLAGDIDQRFGQLIYGNKYDLAFNWAGNINNVFYIGANIGITSLTYRYDDYIREQALHSSDFPIEFDDGVTRFFENAKSRYSYTATGAGLYAQLGFLARLPMGLRVGAMIQTPTVLAVKERWSQDMTIYYNDTDASAESPSGSGAYRLRTPWKVSAGLAWTLGESLLLSADYEMMNYKNMKLRSSYNYDDDFGDANWDISQWMGISHTLRVGAEYKPLPQLALRAGYGLVTSPEKGDDGNFVPKARTMLASGAPRSRDDIFSAGIGYSSDGSFFADLALRIRLRDNSYITPYDNYIDDVYSPEISVLRQNLWDALVTIGWRF